MSRCDRHAGLQLAKAVTACPACYSEVRRENGRLLAEVARLTVELAGAGERVLRLETALVRINQNKVDQ